MTIQQVIYDPRLFSDENMVDLQTQFLDIYESSKKPAAFNISSIQGLSIPTLFPDVDHNDVTGISASRVHRWIEGQASRHPDVLALYWGERKQSMTYRALNNQANQIAHCECICFLLLRADSLSHH